MTVWMNWPSLHPSPVRRRVALYGRVQELLNRQLAQKRGHFRAVLPQALADHLARRALDAIPSTHLLEALLPMSDPRLLTSFAKRLGYLHDHDAAREIVTSWLDPGGILHEIETLNGTGLLLLRNAAPAVPGAVLSALEIRFDKADSEENASRKRAGEPWHHGTPLRKSPMNPNSSRDVSGSLQ